MQDDFKPITILLADDSENDRSLTRKTLRDNRILNELREVGNSEELADYLFQRGKYSAPVDAPRPGLILLDLKLPRDNSSKALQEIKSDLVLQQIPIVVLTKTESENTGSTALTADSYAAKPLKFEALVEAMRKLDKYWIEVVALPDR